MSSESIRTRIQEKFPQLEWVQNTDIDTAHVPADTIFDLIKNLHEDEQLAYQYLTDITAVHYPERSGKEFCVVYHLHALVNNHRLRLKVDVPLSHPKVPSIVSIYSGANWMERETYDFFGIIFEGHPNLTRILNADEMDYHPMRKEYPMEDPTRRDKDDEMFGRGGF